MKKLNKLVTLIFVYLLPLVLLTLLSENWGVLSKALHWGFFSIIFGGLLLTWVVSGIWFFTLIIFSKTNREAILARLANIQERDEREEQIVGRASKHTFLFMLAILLVLFAASTLRYGEGIQNPTDKKHQTITIGQWGLIDNHVDVTTQFDGTTSTKVRLYETLPLSKTGLLLLLIVAQLLTYHFASNQPRKISKIPLAAAVFVLLIVVTALTVKPEYVSWAEFPDLLARAEKGDANVQNKVGEMLLFGDGVKQDFSAAMVWFQRSAAKGNAAAPNHIGRLYLNGEGVEKNVQEACKWYALAAERGDVTGGKENAQMCATKLEK